MAAITQATRRRLAPVGGMPISTASQPVGRGVTARRLTRRLFLAILAAGLMALGLLTLVHPARTVAPRATSAKLSPAARLAVSRGLGADLAGYGLERLGGGFLARNERQSLTASFGARGVTVSARGGARASIALQSIGLGAARNLAGLAQPLARGNRVEYQRTGATEWFANGPAGVEQGFTIAKKPVGAAGGVLTLALGFSGTLTARPGADGSLVLAGAGGKALLRYGDLSVSDATGRTLPAHMTVEHGQVAISVDARGARYPVTVDPLLDQVGELYASEGEKEDQLGSAIAASGDTVVVGEPLDTIAGHIETGAAFVFVEGTSGWTTAVQAAKLVASSPEAEEALGASVAISGRTIVVGATGHKGVAAGPGAGAAFVYDEPTGGWESEAVQTPIAELLNSENDAFYRFGEAVGISGETIVVGAPYYIEYSVSTERVGRAFVFQEPAGGWADEPKPAYQTAELALNTAETEDGDGFGRSIGIEEAGGAQTVVVGSPGVPIGEEAGKYRRGGAYLFTEPAQGWASGSTRLHNPQGRLVASNATEFAKLGTSVSISGDVIAAGAPGAQVEGVEQGATYVFTAPAGGWSSAGDQTQAAELITPGGVSGDAFGESVALEGDTVVSGGLYKNAYLFAMPASGWSGELDPSAEFDGKITAVGLSGGDALMGATFTKPPEENGAPEQGAVDVVPFAPAVSTTGTSGLTEVAATVEGIVSPDQTTLKECRFQYGTSTSYGQEVPCSSFPTTGAASSTVSAALTGLAPGTTYHYRVVAANEVDTGYGIDETFTTSSAPSGGGEGGSKTSTTTTTATTTTTNVISVPDLMPEPQPSPVLACGTAQVALINVIQHGSRVLITGAARLVLAGHSVSIELLGTGKAVASVKIAADGTFSASAPLPPAKIRDTNLARYQASVGPLHSLALKLERRMYMVSATRSGTHVLLSGYVTGSFKAGTVVKILLRVTCSKEAVVAKVKLSRSGRFSVSVAAPTGAASQIAVYRATTTVLDRRHPETTFTLPTPPSG